eukprot:jgi/Hompol1/4863/HPOL_003966-RA
MLDSASFSATSPAPQASSFALNASLQNPLGIDGLPLPLRPSVSTAAGVSPSRKSKPSSNKSSLFDPVSRKKRREIDNRASSTHSQSVFSPSTTPRANPSSSRIHSNAADIEDADDPNDDDEQIQDLMLPYDDFTTIGKPTESDQLTHQTACRVKVAWYNLVANLITYSAVSFKLLDWMRDWMRDHRRKDRLMARRRPGWNTFMSSFFDATQSWILVSIIAIFIGLLASWIDIVAAWLTDVKQGVCSTDWFLSKDICCIGLTRSGGLCEDFHSWSRVLLGVNNISLINFAVYATFSVIFAGTCALLISRLSSYAAGSGTAEVKTILGGFIIKEFLGMRTLLIKSVALPLTVASGLAVGKEGPMIHIACCIGNIFPQLFPKYKENEARKREILSASAAAGVAVAFGAPIGGVLFSLEEMS